jgi:hypothetical protein
MAEDKEAGQHVARSVPVLATRSVAENVSNLRPEDGDELRRFFASSLDVDLSTVRPAQRDRGKAPSHIGAASKAAPTALDACRW